jgi:hypothetical protein
MIILYRIRFDPDSIKFSQNKSASIKIELIKINFQLEQNTLRLSIIYYPAITLLISGPGIVTINIRIVVLSFIFINRADRHRFGQRLVHKHFFCVPMDYCLIFVQLNFLSFAFKVSFLIAGSSHLLGYPVFITKSLSGQIFKTGKKSCLYPVPGW